MIIVKVAPCATVEKERTQKGPGRAALAGIVPQDGIKIKIIHRTAEFRHAKDVPKAGTNMNQASRDATIVVLVFIKTNITSQRHG